MSKTNKEKTKPTLEQFGIEPVAYIMPSDISPYSRLILKIETIDDSTKIIAIPRSIIDTTQKLVKHLIDAGLEHQEKNNWAEIKRLLMKTPTTKYEIVARSGFHDHYYISANNEVIGEHGDNMPFIDPDANLIPTTIGRKNSLKMWKNEVASLGLHSSRIMLALCSAFSAYIIRWSNVETGGFHLWGLSSIGKSSCLYISTSVYGPRESLNQWATTSTAIEETATAYCDLPLGLDELKLLHENQSKAAELASIIIYQLASGKSKSRSHLYKNKALQCAQNWTTTILSTGELSLSDHAKTGGPAQMLGEEVRVPDVPADAGAGMGIFESLPDGVVSPNKLAESINSLTQDIYGSAHKRFLKKLTSNLTEDELLVRNRIQVQMDVFLEKNNVNQNSGYQVRLAKRFALAYAAGIFAIKYKVLDFNKKQILEAISKCYQDSLKLRQPSHSERIEDALIKISNLVETTKFLDIRDKSVKHSDKNIRKAKGYLIIVDNQVVRAIPKVLIDDVINSDNMICRSVIAKLREQKQLAKKSGGKNTRQITLPTSNNKKVRCICFLGTPEEVL